MSDNGFMEIEHVFSCPFCNAEISVLLDVSEDGAQEYIEDCEICCRPMQLRYVSQAGELVEFEAMSADE